jgi:hypothetical protein
MWAWAIPKPVPSKPTFMAPSKVRQQSGGPAGQHHGPDARQPRPPRAAISDASLSSLDPGQLRRATATTTRTTRSSNREPARPGDATVRDVRRSMPAFRSLVSVLMRELGDFSPHPQGRPCGRPPAALRPGNDTTVTGEPAPPSSRGGAEPTTGMLRGPRWGRSRAVNDRNARDNHGQLRASSAQLSSPFDRACQASANRRFALARRKSGVQIPSPPPQHRRSERRQCGAGGAHCMLRPHDGRKR